MSHVAEQDSTNELDFLGEEDGRLGQVDESCFVLEQRSTRGTCGLGRARIQQRVEAVPPELRHAVVLASAGSACFRDEPEWLCVKRVTLNVAPHSEARCQ